MKKQKKGKKRTTPARKVKKKRLSQASLAAPGAASFDPAPGMGAGDPLGEAVGDPLAEAVAALQAGRPEEAFSLCGRVLAAEPDNADALNLAGVAAFQAGGETPIEEAEIRRNR